MPTLRILIGEDHEEFRRMLRAVLQGKTQRCVISEVSDGLQALQQAEVLQPDLILLDVSLPKLNGMAVARQISKLCPNSKILFVSQHSDPDIVLAALQWGARGYLLKSDAKELPLAVDAVLQGAVFVSSRLRNS
jgi:DNA-binding NarL/FixJ family response regulator